jgi:hypothetical protein
MMETTMKTVKTKIWGSFLVLASGLALLAASGAFDDPEPPAMAPDATLNGHSAPPPFGWNDIFKGPR